MQFSIITVCRNDLEGLKLTRDSLYGQSYTDFEWIVVDGKSTDGTSNWLKQLTYTNLSWVSEPDNGIFDAMNKGIRTAKGKYLLFLNSFDELADDLVLQKVNDLITGSKGRLRFIYGDSIDITDEGAALYRKAKHHGTHVRGMFTQHQAMFFINNPDILYNSDYKLVADYAYIGRNLEDIDEQGIAYIDMPVCRFKLGGTNESSRFRALKEDFLIRKNEFRLNTFLCYTLYSMHFMHTVLKRVLPGAARLLRYKQNRLVNN